MCWKGGLKDPPDYRVEMGSETKAKRHAGHTNMCVNPSPCRELLKKGNGRGTFEEITTKCFLELKNKTV